eukprot:g1530.t1
MPPVELTSIKVENNPSAFLDPFRLHIELACTEPLKEALEWKLVYVGSAVSEKYDQ